MPMITNNNNETPRAGLASKSIKLRQSIPSSALSLNNGKSGMSSKSQTSFDITELFHCGNLKHTRENCFKLHGYDDRWHELQARKRQNNVEIQR